MSKKHNGPKWRQEGSRQVATITQSAQDVALARRRAMREALKAAGMLGKSMGSGFHGGNITVNNRRDRRFSRIALRTGGYDDCCNRCPPIWQWLQQSSYGGFILLILPAPTNLQR
jgi:hypothetical protein